eukprot:11025394-Alexandrium_andersonii.AAC.1
MHGDWGIGPWTIHVGGVLLGMHVLWVVWVPLTVAESWLGVAVPETSACGPAPNAAISRRRDRTSLQHADRPCSAHTPEPAIAHQTVSGTARAQAGDG